LTSEHLGRTGEVVERAAERPGRLIAGDGVRPFEIADHRCFACGSLNEQGLQLTIHVERGRSWTELELQSRFEGWAGITHGGILCTILDEVMAWALVGEDNWGLTAKLAVEFKRPVPTGRRIRAEGVVTRSRRRLVETEGSIVDAIDSATLAVASATYVAAEPGRRAELQARYGFRYLEPAGAASRG
jgi:acyl-coenzyme A thioesterase PaaI-like protein